MVSKNCNYLFIYYKLGNHLCHIYFIQSSSQREIPHACVGQAMRSIHSCGPYLVRACCESLLPLFSVSQEDMLD